MDFNYTNDAILSPDIGLSVANAKGRRREDNYCYLILPVSVPSGVSLAGNLCNSILMLYTMRLALAGVPKVIKASHKCFINQACSVAY
jgi:hypothetical protein